MCPGDPEDISCEEEDNTSVLADKKNNGKLIRQSVLERLINKQIEIIKDKNRLKREIKKNHKENRNRKLVKDFLSKVAPEALMGEYANLDKIIDSMSEKEFTAVLKRAKRWKFFNLTLLPLCCSITLIALLISTALLGKVDINIPKLDAISKFVPESVSGGIYEIAWEFFPGEEKVTKNLTLEKAKNLKSGDYVRLNDNTGHLRRHGMRHSGVYMVKEIKEITEITERGGNCIITLKSKSVLPESYYEGRLNFGWTWFSDEE